VHDDALEPSEQGAPHRRLGERAPRDHVVRRENGRAARMEQPPIQLGGAEPLRVDDVWLRCGKPGHPERVLERLHR
jgi:hypothetical protein